ncbi:MAG TPA: hypothetical protein VGG39_26810 [Polyangiaceae bacterium]|jgi:hypothetical protein
MIEYSEERLRGLDAVGRTVERLLGTPRGPEALAIALWNAAYDDVDKAIQDLAFAESLTDSGQTLASWLEQTRTTLAELFPAESP